MIDMSKYSAAELVNLLEPMIAPFREIEKRNARIWLSENRESASKRYEHWDKPIGVAIAIIMAVVSIWFFDHVYTPNHSEILFIVLVIGGGIGGIFLFRKVFVGGKVKAENADKAQIIANCRDEIAEIIPTIPNLDCIPDSYLYYDAINSLYTYFRDGRASSWKEGINLYEEECHRRRMEDMAQMQAQAAMNAEIYAKATAGSVRSLNRNVKNLSSDVSNLNQQMATVNMKLHM